MSEAIYQQAILDHARAAVGAGRLDEPDGKATVDNPLCGDRVTVEVRLDGDTIAAVAHQVRGCLLCEASASVLARHATGRPPEALRQAAREFEAMIRSGAAVPAGWPELEVFTPVRQARSRHECVLLPFQAVERAIADAGG